MPFSTPFPGSPNWDPKIVLELVNSHNGAITCVGYAHGPGRRCRRAVASCRYSQELANLAQLDPTTAANAQILYVLANGLLCWQHKDQVSSIFASWQGAIEKYSCDDSKSGFKEEDFGPEAFARFQKQFEEFMARYAAFQEYYQQQHSGSSTSQQKAQSQDSKPQARKGPSQSQTNNSQQKPHNAKMKEEQPEQAKSSQRPQSQPQSNCNRKHPTPEMPKSWSEVWSKYTQDWEAIQADPTDRDVKVPWPVRSGKFSDVTLGNVREFFTKGPVSGRNSISDAEMYSMMNKECMKWHPDKLFGRFDSLTRDQVQETTNMIIIFVCGLRDTARDKRNRQRAASL